MLAVAWNATVERPKKLVTTRSAEPVAVQVAGGDPHAGERLTLAVARDPGRLADLLEPEVSAVGEQPAWCSVVGDIDIGPVVTCQLGDQYAQAPAVGLVDAGQTGEVGERAITVVAVKPVGLRRKVFGAAVVAPAVGGRAVRRRIRIKIKIVRHVEVQIAITVEIGEGGRRAPEARR